MNSKTCSSCETEKPVEEFNRHKNGVNGRHNWCRCCEHARYVKNRETILLKKAKYYSDNREEVGRKAKEYWEKNRATITPKRRLHFRKRRAEDPLYKLIVGLRTRTRAALKVKGVRKCSSSAELLGCSPQEARAHLEKQFRPGMTWENHGSWHVDHIRPCASFDLRDPEQQRICFHFTNLQPLWWKDNLRKSDTWNPTVDTPAQLSECSEQVD